MLSQIADTFDLREEIDKKWISEALDKIMEKLLNEKERIVLKERIYNKRTLKEVGFIIQRTGNRVRCIESKALRILGGIKSVKIMAKYNIQFAEKSLLEFKKQEISRKTEEQIYACNNLLTQLINNFDCGKRMFIINGKILWS